MRILDKNKDFYDYLQDIYKDDTFTFDRRDSYNLSKKELASHFVDYGISWYKIKPNMGFILLQVCNTFWLASIELEFEESGLCKDYKINSVLTWKNYNAKRKLINLSVFNRARDFSFLQFNNNDSDINYWKEKFLHMEEPQFGMQLNKFFITQDMKRIEKHIPILKDTGLASFIEPLDIYLAFEEYFSKEKTESERTESIGLTDTEKVENHGFDKRTSFRGKNK